jgi:hypothetical protein
MQEEYYSLYIMVLWVGPIILLYFCVGANWFKLLCPDFPYKHQTLGKFLS